jgi:hypothetical protein
MGFKTKKLVKGKDNALFVCFLAKEVSFRADKGE